MPNVNEFGLLSPTYKNISASVLVKAGVGKLRGIFVASSTTGSIQLWDSLTAATTILVNTFSPTAATYYDFADVLFGTGLYITIGGTLDATIFYF